MGKGKCSDLAGLWEPRQLSTMQQPHQHAKLCSQDCLIPFLSNQPIWKNVERFGDTGLETCARQEAPPNDASNPLHSHGLPPYAGYHLLGRGGQLRSPTAEFSYQTGLEAASRAKFMQESPGYTVGLWTRAQVPSVVLQHSERLTWNKKTPSRGLGLSTRRPRARQKGSQPYRERCDNSPYGHSRKFQGRNTCWTHSFSTLKIYHFIFSKIYFGGY